MSPLLAVLTWLCLPRPIFVTLQYIFQHSILFYVPSAEDADLKTREGAYTRPFVALTVDDAPVAWEFDQRTDDMCSTAEIRDELAKYGARATWFVISGQTPGRRPLVRSLLSDGHELGNHGTADRPACLLGKEFSNDVEQAQAVINSCGGRKTWFRPGSALLTCGQLEWLQRNQYRVAIGNIYPHDALDLPPWQFAFPRLAAWFLMWKVRAGDIIIIHDRPWTPPMLRRMLPALTKRFTLCTLSELVDSVERAGSNLEMGEQTIERDYAELHSDAD